MPLPAEAKPYVCRPGVVCVGPEILGAAGLVALAVARAAGTATIASATAPVTNLPFAMPNIRGRGEYGSRADLSRWRHRRRRTALVAWPCGLRIDPLRAESGAAARGRARARAGLHPC